MISPITMIPAFISIHPNAAILKNEIATLPGNASEGVNLICADGLEYLKSLPSKPYFDLIFLDPPFGSDLLEAAVEIIVSKDLLNDGGIVYVEMGSAKKKQKDCIRNR